MSVGKFAAVYTPRARETYYTPDVDVTTLPSDAELAHRATERVKAKALLDAHRAADLAEMLGLTNE